MNKHKYIHIYFYKEHFCVKDIVSKCMPNDLKDIKEIKSKGQLGVENDELGVGNRRRLSLLLFSTI